MNQTPTHDRPLANLLFDCPRCGLSVNHSVSTKGLPGPPRAGDLSVCAFCAAPLRLTCEIPDWLTLEEIPQERYGELAYCVLLLLTDRNCREAFHRKLRAVYGDKS